MWVGSQTFFNVNNFSPPTSITDQRRLGLTVTLQSVSHELISVPTRITACTLLIHSAAHDVEKLLCQQWSTASVGRLGLMALHLEAHRLYPDSNEALATLIDWPCTVHPFRSRSRLGFAFQSLVNRRFEDPNPTHHTTRDQRTVQSLGLPSAPSLPPSRVLVRGQPDSKGRFYKLNASHASRRNTALFVSSVVTC